MNRARAEAVLEAVLFTMGESVEISRLADVIEEDVRTTKEILKGMEERYGREDRGITLTRFENAVQLCTKSDMYEYLVRIAKTPKKLSLTDTVLETLSIIAYKQPVTRMDIERVRGVSCDHANTEQCLDLVERELHRLCTVPLTPRRLAMAKRQFIAQLAISMESNEGYMLGTGKSFLLHDRVDTMEEVYAKIGALTASALTAAAEEVFGRTSRLIYK